MTEPDVLRDPSGLEELAPAWRDLAGACGASYFATPDWVLGWLETLGREVPGQPLVAVWRDGDGRPDAVVPLLRTRQALHPRLPGALGVPCLTALGSGPGAADHCGFAVAPGRAGDVRAWLARAARRTSLWLPHLDDTTGAAHLPARARQFGSTACPAMPAEPTTMGSARLRKDLRAYVRKLAAEGVTFRFASPGQGPGAMDGKLLDVLLELHAERQRALCRATTFDASRAPLHERLFARSAQDRGPCAVVADGPDGVVGVLYGFLWNGTFSYYQTGWSPQFARLSLGTVLVAETVAAVASHGAHEFDFLRGAEEYKYRFGAVDRHDGTWLVAHGIGGRLLGARARMLDARATRAAHQEGTPQ